MNEKLKQADDDQLMQDLAKGNNQAFDILFDRYWRINRGLACLSLRHDRPDCGWLRRFDLGLHANPDIAAFHDRCMEANESRIKRDRAAAIMQISAR